MTGPMRTRSLQLERHGPERNPRQLLTTSLDFSIRSARPQARS